MSLDLSCEPTIGASPGERYLVPKPPKPKVEIALAGDIRERYFPIPSKVGLIRAKKAVFRLKTTKMSEFSKRS